MVSVSLCLDGVPILSDLVVIRSLHIEESDFI